MCVWRAKKTGKQADEENWADYRPPLRTGDAQKKSAHDIGIGCLHLQFAERFPFALRGGKLRSEANRVNSEMSLRIEHPNQFVAPTSNAWRSGSTKIFQTRCLFLFASTCACGFLSQENFFVAIENKIHFFLVAFVTDF